MSASVQAVAVPVATPPAPVLPGAYDGIARSGLESRASKLPVHLANFKHLRSFLALCEHGSIERASAQTQRTKSAVVRSIQELEEHFGVRLFERPDGGWLCNISGEVVRCRAERGLREFSSGLAMMGHCAAGQRFPDSLFHEERLNAFIALTETGNVAAASTGLGVTTLGICRLIYALERSLNVILYIRTPGGMLPTAAAQAFLPHARSTLFELKQIEPELGALRNARFVA